MVGVGEGTLCVKQKLVSWRLSSGPLGLLPQEEVSFLVPWRYSGRRPVSENAEAVQPSHEGLD